MRSRPGTPRCVGRETQIYWEKIVIWVQNKLSCLEGFSQVLKSLVSKVRHALVPELGRKREIRVQSPLKHKLVSWLRTRNHYLWGETCYCWWLLVNLHHHKSSSLRVKEIFLRPFIPSSSDSKESAYNAGDPGSIPGSGRPPGEGNDYPLQYSCLKNPIDRGAWWATAHEVAKSQTPTEWLTLFFISPKLPQSEPWISWVHVFWCFSICTPLQILFSALRSPDLCLPGGEADLWSFHHQIPWSSGFWFSQWEEIRRWEEREIGVFSLLAPSLPDHSSSCAWFPYRHSWAVGLGDKGPPPMATALISHRNSTSSITPPGLEEVMISYCCPDPGHLTILLSVSSALPPLLSISLLLNSLRCAFWFLLVTWLTHALDKCLLCWWCSAMTPRKKISGFKFKIT